MRRKVQYNTQKNTVILLVQIFWTHHSVISWGVMFCVIVRPVMLTWFPNELDLVLLYTIFEPVVTHVPCLRFLGLDELGKKISRSVVVGNDWNAARGLRMLENVLKDVTNGDGGARIFERSATFGFCGRGHDVSETSAFD